ncbi:response regulator transcription factor [Desertihabitans aurantiacus]|uniref:response regulator transcription factor n=1 Tax=Desertihabitans aurantiacus TaxID=2282477 RepID=UPI000DF752FB|nr:response regulator transcription factor [Desertihabitans aurantiacus]
MSSVLIVEDEPRIAAFVEKGLRAAGYATLVVGDGPGGLDHALTGDFDLMVLDIGLPGMDGLSVLENLRGQGSTMPVIILTARDSVADTVTGFESGADDYLAKPFRFEELVARIKVRLRDRPAAASSTRTVGALTLDLHSRTVRVDGGREVELSAREFALLDMFLQHPRQVLSREQLLSRVWGYDFDPGSNVVDVYVRYLRNKIGPERISTVRGAGYRLTG